MDSQEMTRRGAGLLVGSLFLVVGGLLALYGVMYDPIDATDPTGLTGGITEVTDGARLLFTAIAVGGILLGGWAAYLYRGSVPMQLMCGVVVVACGYNLIGMLGS